MVSTPCVYDNQTSIYQYNSIAPEAANTCGAGTTYSHAPSHGTPRPFMPHTCSSNRLRLSEASLTLHHDELNSSPSLPHPSYSLSPAGSGSFDNAPIYCRDLNSPQSFDTHSSWSLHPPPSDIAPSVVYCVSPPVPRHYTSNSTSYTHFPFQQSLWPDVDVQASVADEYTPPSYSPSSASSLHNSDASLTQVDCASGPYGGVSGALYPCQWTEGGFVCNVMVQATRSHMNRHLHAQHGFGGSDVRQTRCHWAGCGEVMQQGSIARHMVTCHLQAKVTCPMCSKKLSRQDVISKHQRVCPAASAQR